MAGDGNLEYQAIVVNRGRFAIADMSIKINFSVPGLLSKHEVFAFYMRDLTVSWVDSKEQNQYVIGPRHLFQDDEQKEYCAKLEKRVGQPLRQMGMRDLMEACDGSFLTVFVASNHSFSGARSFKRAVFTVKDFMPESGVCEREDCCQASQARSSSLTRTAAKLANLMSLKG